MMIKEICRNHPFDYYMSTPSAINHLGIKINTPPVASEMCSFAKSVLHKKPKGFETKFKNWILFKL